MRNTRFASVVEFGVVRLRCQFWMSLTIEQVVTQLQQEVITLKAQFLIKRD